MGFDSAANELTPGIGNGGGVYVRDAWAASTVDVAVNDLGEPGNAGSSGGSFSADGQVVAFTSPSTNLVPDDKNGKVDIFVRDLDSPVAPELGAVGKGRTELLSAKSDGTQSNGSSFSPEISGDGRFVAFVSLATNLAPGTSGDPQVFIKDRQTGALNLISLSTQGVPGNGASSVFAISDSGRFVGFTSSANNLVSGDTNATADVFIRDRDADGDGDYDRSGDVETSRVSISTDGLQANDGSQGSSMSADGRYVSFMSWATDFVGEPLAQTPQVYLRDIALGTTDLVSRTSDGGQMPYSWESSVSDDGRDIAFRSGGGDVFVRDRQESLTSIISVAMDGGPANAFSFAPLVSGDGRYVAFDSFASNLAANDTNNSEDVFIGGIPRCSDGAPIDGPVSAKTEDQIEPVASQVNAQGAVRQATCALLVPLRL